MLSRTLAKYKYQHAQSTAKKETLRTETFTEKCRILQRKIREREKALQKEKKIFL